MAAEGRVYLSGENLEELHELLEGGFLDDDEDFNWKVLLLRKKMWRKIKFMRVKFVEKNVYIQEV